MDLQIIAFLFAVGVFGCGWNAIAGGATLFTFPALMAAGLPPIVANATNFLAMMPSNAAALTAYRAELRSVGSAIYPLLIVSGLGAIIGSLLLMISDPSFFTALIPWLILVATMLFAFGDTLRARLIAVTGGDSSQTVMLAALFLSSIYCGYFGAGLGIILLAIVQVMGFTSFHVANSMKNLLATSFTLLSIGIFGIGGLIAWPEAVVMMAGSTLGGYFGGRLARRVNQRYLRGAVIVFGLILAGVYFWRNVAG